MGALLVGRYGASAAAIMDRLQHQPGIGPHVSYNDVLQATPVPCRLKDRKIIVGGTALELGDRFNIPNGSMFPAPWFRRSSRKLILQSRILHPARGW